MHLSHLETITIDAPCQTVYDLVRDVTRTGEWSPTCRSCEWEDPARTGPGARFTGHNATSQRTWTTTSTVVVDVPGREFSWEVGAGYVRWAYLLSPRPDGGTDLTHSWHFTDAGQEYFRERFGTDAPIQVAARTAAAHEDMPRTLQAIKRLAERETHRPDDPSSG